MQQLQSPNDQKKSDSTSDFMGGAETGNLNRAFGVTRRMRAETGIVRGPSSSGDIFMRPATGAEVDSHFSLAQGEGEDVHVYVRLTRLHEQGAERLLLSEAASQTMQRIDCLPAEVRRRVRIVLLGADALLSEHMHSLTEAQRGLRELAAAVRVLAGAGLPTTWKTRAGINGPFDPVLAAACRDATSSFSVDIGLAGMDVQLSRALEGSRVAFPEARMRLAEALVARGVSVRLFIDPLVPLLNDTHGDLRALCEQAVKRGVRRVAARYLTLVRGGTAPLFARCTKMQRALIDGLFARERWQRMDWRDQDSGLVRAYKNVPCELRQQGIERLRDLTGELGMRLEPADAQGAPVQSLVPLPHQPQLDLFQLMQ